MIDNTIGPNLRYYHINRNKNSCLKKIGKGIAIFSLGLMLGLPAGVFAYTFYKCPEIETRPEVREIVKPSKMESCVVNQKPSSRVYLTTSSESAGAGTNTSIIESIRIPDLTAR